MATLLSGGDTRSMAYYPKRKAENASTDGDVSKKSKTSPRSTTTNSTRTATTSRTTTTNSTTTVNSTTSTNDSMLDVPLVSAESYIKDIDVKTFSGLENLKKTIRTLSHRLQDGKTEKQYYAFKPVPKGAVDRIYEDPSCIGRGTRITYFWNEEVMIVKLMPSKAHETPHTGLTDQISHQFLQMGIPALEFTNVGAGKQDFPVQGLSKEPDGSYQPYSVRPNMNDWPTLIIECGYSESLHRLQNDARLWIGGSRGETKIVVIISIQKQSKTLQIEKWCDQPGPLRRSPRLQPPGSSPGISHTVTVSHIPNTPISQPASWNVVGAPLILEFDQIFLRPAVLPETDVSLAAVIFQGMAVMLWRPGWLP